MLDKSKLQHLAELLAVQTELEFINDGYTYDGGREWIINIIPGRKFTKIDVGRAGRYMIDNETGIIYGIKAYGVIHRGHRYGTLDTVDEWNWSRYRAQKRVIP